MCNILKMSVRRSKGIKFGIRGPRNCICRVRSMSVSFGSVLGSSGISCQLFDVKIFDPTIFIQIQPHFMESMQIRLEYSLLLCMAICQI